MHLKVRSSAPFRKQVRLTIYAEDPFTSILLGGNLSLSHLELRANVQAALIGGEVHALSIGPGPANIVGVSIWYPPGKSLFSR